MWRGRFERSQTVARIAGVNVPTKKRVEIALTYIHGIGRTSAKGICERAGVPDERRVADLSEEELTKLRDIIDADFLVEGDLRRKTSMDIKRYLDLGCLRGLRHRRNLPVRGQRTHTNAPGSVVASGRTSPAASHM